MIIAPHSDDAELAAFGLYSRAREISILTLTQGEIEAEAYQPLGLEQAAAARLKGRLRAWDSLAVPLWGGVPQSQCLQLGYYCLQLPAMQALPDQAFGCVSPVKRIFAACARTMPCRFPAIPMVCPAGAICWRIWWLRLSTTSLRLSSPAPAAGPAQRPRRQHPGAVGGD